MAQISLNDKVAVRTKVSKNTKNQWLLCAVIKVMCYSF